MNEAARCDRIALMDAGRVLAMGAPANSSRRADAPTSKTPSSIICKKPVAAHGAANRQRPGCPPSRERRRRASGGACRLSACAGCWPTRSARASNCCAIRSASASRFFGTAFLMIVFGAGISTDVNNFSFAVLDRDNSHESRAYLEELRGSTYFIEKAPIEDQADLENRLKSGDIKAAIEIPPDFGRFVKKGYSDRSRRMGRWRHAISRRDDSRISPGRSPAVSFGLRGAQPARPPPTHPTICAKLCATRRSRCSTVRM